MKITANQKNRILLLNIIVPFLLGMGVDLYVPSLPAIAHYFQSSHSLVQLTISLYMLGYGSGQLFLGLLSDSIGRKKIILFGSLCFTIVSFAAIFSPNIYYLNACRLLQGLSIAGLGAACRAMSVDCFADLDLTKAMSYITVSWSTGPIIGPFIGGYLQHYFNWQSNFLLFGIYGLLMSIFILFAIPETNKNLIPLRPHKIYRSIKKVLSSAIFIYCALALVFVYASLVLFNLIGPFIIQIDLKYSAVDYGHIALLLGFSYFLGNFINRWIITYFRPIKIVLTTIFCAFLMSILMLILGLFIKMNLLIIIIPIFIMFFFCGFAFPNVMGKALSLFPKTAGTASALFGTMVTMGVFSITIVATFLKTNTQIPLAWMYLGMMFLSLILLFFSWRLERSS